MNDDKKEITGLKLDRIAFYGRTAEEYQQIFGIDPESLAGLRVLDCAAGSASFTAEMGELGFDVTACDPHYQLGPEELRQKGEADITYMVGQMKKTKGQFDWSFYGDLNNRERYARRSLARFVDDVEARPERYAAASLPSLPFDDGAFDLVICAHFLFVYAAYCDQRFHQEALQELVRVCRGQVMVYPLVQASGAPYDDLDTVRKALAGKGIESEVAPTSWAFVAGADSLLRLFPKRGAVRPDSG